MNLLYISTLLLLVISLLASPQKTGKALLLALKKFLSILPTFLSILILISISLYLLPEHVISEYLSNNNLFSGTLIATLIGSIVLMPGFVVYPLSGILLKQGVPYTTIAAFTTTLMMVGLMTLPLEKKYLGMKIALLRNLVGLFVALIVSLSIGIFFGEI